MIGFWATLSLNMPDFTRFGRSQREQIIGQVVALPTTMSVFAAMGVLITSATAIIYGESIWDPVELVGKFSSPVVVAISMFTVVVATLAVNIAANVVSPANDFANAFPRLISFKTGGLITGILGIAIQPWRLLADPSGYIFTWLLGYSGGLGSIAGVLIADYWIVRRRELQLEDLYLPDGVYRGWNLPRDRGHRDRLRARLGRPRRSGAEAAVRLRLVRGLLRRRPRAPGAGAAVDDTVDRVPIGAARVRETRFTAEFARLLGFFPPRSRRSQRLRILFMDLRQLEILQAIAETGSFTACGRKLHVSQSAISRQILLLEEELGEPLFLRVGRQVRMTPAAESLVQLGQRVFLDVRETVGAITDRTRELRGTLRLSGGMTVCLYVFPPLLKHMRRVHPHLDVRLTVATAGRSVQEIRGGRVDAGLLTLPVVESDLVTVPVLREELLLMTTPTHPLAKRRKCRAARPGRAAVHPVRDGLGRPAR